MNDELYTRLSELPSERLLVILAFFMNQYTRDAQIVLQRLGHERGIGDEDILRFRRLALLPKAAAYTCQNCRERIDLEEPELRSGQFTCPVCMRLQMINYRLIPGCAENLDFSEDDERSLLSVRGGWEDESPRTAPAGIGGWLIVLAVLLGLGLVINLVFLPDAIEVGGLGLLANLVNIVAFGGLLALMGRRARLFPPLTVVWFLYTATSLMLQGITSPSPLTDPRGYLGVAVAGIWVPYLLRSARVQATFILSIRSQRPSAPADPPKRPASPTDPDLIA